MVISETFFEKGWTIVHGLWPNFGVTLKINKNGIMSNLRIKCNHGIYMQCILYFVGSILPRVDDGW